jgi:hypothetical protein
MVGKMCRRMDVPKPLLGYWRRKETGKQVGRPPLPMATERTVGSVYISGTIGDPGDARFPNEVLELVEQEQLPENQIRISASLENASPQVQRVQRYFSQFDRFRKDVIELPQGEGYLNVSVCPFLAERALLIADALMKALEKRGYEVRVSKDHWRGEATRICRNGVEIELSIFEQVNKFQRELTEEERRKPPYLIVDTFKARSSGKLAVKIRSYRAGYRSWGDGLDRALEDRLNEVLVGVVMMMEPLILANRARVEEENRRLERIRKSKEEARNIEQLQTDAARWATSRNLREYLRAYRGKMIEIHGRIPDGSREANWLEWAEDYVEKLDPLNNIPTDAEAASRRHKDQHE